MMTANSDMTSAQLNLTAGEEPEAGEKEGVQVSRHILRIDKTVFVGEGDDNLCRAFSDLDQPQYMELYREVGDALMEEKNETLIALKDQRYKNATNGTLIKAFLVKKVFSFS